MRHIHDLADGTIFRFCDRCGLYVYVGRGWYISARRDGPAWHCFGDPIVFAF